MREQRVLRDLFTGVRITHKNFAIGTIKSRGMFWDGGREAN